jgi:hypothetical protein
MVEETYDKRSVFLLIELDSIGTLRLGASHKVIHLVIVHNIFVGVVTI